MPSKAKSRKKADTNNDLGAFAKGVADVLGNMTLDEQTIRSTFSAAKKGSLVHISMIGQFIAKLPAKDVPEAISTLCAILDVPAFPPEQHLPSSLSSSRMQALYSLVGLAQIPESVLSDEHSPSHRILEQKWPMIFNWMQQFHFELITSQYPKSSDPSKDIWPPIIATAVPTIISNVVNHDEVFKRLMIKDNDLLNLLVKIWLTPDDFIPHHLLISHHLKCCHLLHQGLTIMDIHDPSGMRSILDKIIQIFLHEVGGNARVVTKKLLRQLRNPKTACGESLKLIHVTLGVIHYLIDERLEYETTSKLMDNLLKDDLVPHVAHLLSFVSEDIAKSPERQVLSEDASSKMVEFVLRLLLRSITSRNGPYWVTRLLNLEFLPAVARILSSARCLNEINKEILVVIIGGAIPSYLCHRIIVVSAIKAVKKATDNGDVAKLEASALREPWMNFTNILLERTVFNTVFERDFSTFGVRKCENCRKNEQETSLFKCAGCLSSLYCSKECQTISWKTGGHRSQCKVTKEVKFDTGMGTPTDKFLDFVALAELRRHMPGMFPHLASIQNPSGIPLEDDFFTVSFVHFPPTVTVAVRSDGTLPTRQPRRNISDRGSGMPDKFEVQSYWGGRTSYATSFVCELPPNIRLWAPGEKFAGDAEVDNVYRKPAKDENGNNLAFVLDEIDRHVMDARKHFRPPVAGDKGSPRTIYDYVEAKAAADPKVLAWMGLK